MLAIPIVPRILGEKIRARTKLWLSRRIIVTRRTHRGKLHAARFALIELRLSGVARRLVDICHCARWNYWRPGREWLDRKRLNSASRPEEWLDVRISANIFAKRTIALFLERRGGCARARTRVTFPASFAEFKRNFVEFYTCRHTHTRVPLFLREIRRVNAPTNDRSRNNSNFFAIIIWQWYDFMIIMISMTAVAYLYFKY